MIERNRDHLERQLAAYLDGRLPDQDREGFERLLAQDAPLAAMVARQREIDEALRRRLAAPSAEAVLNRIDWEEVERRRRPAAAAAAAALLTASSSAPSGGASAAATRRASWLRRIRPLYLATGVAAVIGLGVFGWMVKQIVDARSGGAPTAPSAMGPAYGPGYSPYPGDACGMPGQSADEVYRAVVASGFKPLWVCKDAAEFRQTFEKRLGQPLVVHETDDVKMVGLSYGAAVPGQTTVLLARAAGREVLVFVDRQGGPEFKVKPNSNLNLYERRFGSLVLREVSPLDSPRVLGLFAQPGLD